MTDGIGAAAHGDDPDTEVLRVEGLGKTFGLGRALGRGGRATYAVQDVTFDVRRGEVVAVVGETGSGKTTLGNCVAGIIRPTVGRVLVDGVDVTRTSAHGRSAARRKVQPIFQDPRSSLDPRWSVERTIREPLDIWRIGSAAQRQERVVALMGLVGLPTSLRSRRPHELSGGQQQRVAIAAALALEPELIVADEPVSALDVSIQAQILNLIADLRESTGVAVLFITHDMAVVRHISDRVLVMYMGRLMEAGTVEQILLRPAHPYTKALLEAVPTTDPSRRHSLPGASSRAPGQLIATTEGCAFAPRCPLATTRCTEVRPPEVVVEPGHSAACIRIGGGDDALDGRPAGLVPQQHG